MRLRPCYGEQEASIFDKPPLTTVPSGQLTSPLGQLLAKLCASERVTVSRPFELLPWNARALRDQKWHISSRIQIKQPISVIFHPLSENGCAVYIASRVSFLN